MRPLKQGEPRYPVEADAIELLRSEGRYEPAPGQKQRVTARLLSEGRASRRARWVSAPVVVALSLCAAGASAAAGGRWVTRGYQALADSLSGQRHVSVPAARAPKAAPRKVAPKEAPEGLPTMPAPNVEHSDPAPQVEAAPLAHAVVLPKSVPRAVSAHASAGTAPQKSSPPVHDEAARPEPRAAEDSTLVVGAMRALRQEGRPDNAGKQLDEYLRRYPAGALAEEALALSVEAATQRGDSSARELAERYLARYPSGRFRRAAERARALFSK